MYLLATGMACPVGLSAKAACAAMRAGIAMFTELSYVDNRCEPIVGAPVPTLPVFLRGEERLIELLSLAVADCLSDGCAWPLERIPLLVGLAEPKRPGGGAALAQRVVGEVQRKLGVRFHPQWSQAIPRGHTSAFRALKTYREMGVNDAPPACLVCGVDSYLGLDSLEWLEEHRRLKTSENSDGVIPGEAAAAVMVQRDLPTRAICPVKVMGLGVAHEEAHVLSEEPLLGLGLADAARAALREANLEMHDVAFRLSDVTGESYGFKEQEVAAVRLIRKVRDAQPLWHYADSIGDIGAAAGACQLVVAFHAFLHGYAPGSPVACYTSAVPGERAVAVVGHEAKPRDRANAASQGRVV